MKNKLQQDILGRATALFDLPQDTVAGVPRVALIGLEELRVENHRGILAYETQEICVSGGGYIIRVVGENLDLRAMTGAELLITGRISAITLE